MPPAEQGRPMGHEFLGTVEDLGSEVSGLDTETTSYWQNQKGFPLDLATR